MPIFEYKCSKCGHVTEFLEKPGTVQKHRCEKCQSCDLQRLLSGFAVGQSRSANQASASCSSGSCSMGSCSDGMCPIS